MDSIVHTLLDTAPATAGILLALFLVWKDKEKIVKIFQHELDAVRTRLDGCETARERLEKELSDVRGRLRIVENGGHRGQA